MMRRFIPALTAALFSVVTFSVYAIDEPTDPNSPSSLEKLAKKKKSESPTVQQSGNPADQSGQNAAQPSGAGDVQQGNNASGRGDPTGTTMTPGAAPTNQSPYNKQ
jgi:hypothetical protein